MGTTGSKHLVIVGMLEALLGLLHVILFLVVGASSLFGCTICANAEQMGDLFAGTAWTLMMGIIGLGGALLFGLVTLAGLALHSGATWAKVATIIFAIFMIPEFPWGTAFGVYAFWAIFAADKRGY